MNKAAHTPGRSGMDGAAHPARRPGSRAPRSWLGKLRCPSCRRHRLASLGRAGREAGAWGVRGLRCRDCGERYPVEAPGILRLIPRGDYSRYAYWEKIHAKHVPAEIAARFKRRFSYPRDFLLNFYAMPRLALKLGWKTSDCVELGAQFGSNALALREFGVAREIWLLDISRVALRQALAFYAAMGGAPPFAVQGEIHSLPFRDGAFGLSLSGGLYEHFIGEEQEALVAENCRISRRVLCQVPESSLAYWVYRGALSALNGFRWPFGFEVPLSWDRLRQLYERAGARVEGRDWHNLASAALMVVGERCAPFRALNIRPGFFYLFRHDAVLAASVNHGGRDGKQKG